MYTFIERLKEYSQNEVKECETFSEIMQNMDMKLRNWVVLDLHDETKASVWTIMYGWGSGRSKPLRLQQEIIAKYFNSTCDKLFPK